MFKQGDYIVVLKDSSPENNWKNFVIKQIKNYNEIMPVVTPKGYDNSDYNQTYSHFNAKDDVWRHATLEEIAEYERIGGPFDTSKFEKFILPKNWHIVVTEENAEDVLKWRYEEHYKEEYHIPRSTNKIVGMCNPGEKGSNPIKSIKGLDYDFGIEITYQQFKEHVLKQSPVKHKYLIDLLKKLKIK